ncbi:hypothetical protein ACFE04_000219 [Oxalis oulophora]
MLSRYKAIALNTARNIFQLRNLRTTAIYDHTLDNDEKNKKRKENQEDYIQFYKSMGQHILTNQRILDSIVRASDIESTDTVLEIGPGTGNLTIKLLELAKKVVAIELDKRMIDVLNKRVVERGSQDQLTIISKDALKTDFPQFDLAVANIPYNISSPLVTKLVYGAKSNPFRSATLLLQKEFARRLLANPGDSEYNRLAANVKLMADVELVMDVSKRDFFPAPKVDSSVVIIRPKADIHSDVNLNEWLAFTRMCFGNKNKTLGAIFKQKKKVVELSKTKSLKMKDLEVNAENYDFTDIDDEKIDNRHSDENHFGETSLFKEKIVNILKSGGFEDKRPSKMSNDQLLDLLFLFNQADIKFS